MVVEKKDKKSEVAKKPAATKKPASKEVPKKAPATPKAAPVAKPEAKSAAKPATAAKKNVGKTVKNSEPPVTGKRKTSVARIKIAKGTGKITINKKPAEEYLKRPILFVIVKQPFQITDTLDQYDVDCNVCGGGLSGQAGALKHAISIALQQLDPELRKTLKKAGFLTRDSRVVERKKPGLKGARKGQVYLRR